MSIVGTIIMLAVAFYAFEYFWLSTVERTKNDDIHNEMGTHTWRFTNHTGRG